MTVHEPPSPQLGQPSRAVEHQPPISWAGFSAAIRTSWILIAVIAAVFGAAGAAVGLTSQQTYTAQTQLNVGGGDLTAQSIPGYAVGVQSLASAFSRAISADRIITATANEVGRPPSDVRGSLSASPIPESPLILIEATGKTAAAAVGLANAGGKQLITYVSGQKSVSTADTVLSRFRKASADLAGAQRRLGVLKSQLGGRKNLSGAQKRRLQNAQSSVDVAQLETRTLSAQYASHPETGSDPNVVRVLAEASTATSDRQSRTERLTLAGITAGLVAGFGVALFRRRHQHP